MEENREQYQHEHQEELEASARRHNETMERLVVKQYIKEPVALPPTVQDESEDPLRYIPHWLQ